MAVGAATARPLVDPWMTTLPQDLLAAATTTLTAGTTDRLLTLMVRLGHMIARHHPGISLLEMHREVAIRLGMRRTHLATMTAVVATGKYISLLLALCICVLCLRSMLRRLAEPSLTGGTRLLPTKQTNTPTSPNHRMRKVYNDKK